jgi:superfamily II DNA helicase RecQ
MVVVMGTGEGKSMLWQVPAKLQPHIKNVVVISSAANLVNQHKRALDMGLKAYHYRF